jgi:hypothetical protein
MPGWRVYLVPVCLAFERLPNRPLRRTGLRPARWQDRWADMDRVSYQAPNFDVAEIAGEVPSEIVALGFWDVLTDDQARETLEATIAEIVSEVRRRKTR